MAVATSVNPDGDGELPISFVATAGNKRGGLVETEVALGTPDRDQEISISLVGCSRESGADASRREDSVGAKNALPHSRLSGRSGRAGRRLVGQDLPSENCAAPYIPVFRRICGRKRLPSPWRPRVLRMEPVVISASRHHDFARERSGLYADT